MIGTDYRELLAYDVRGADLCLIVRDGGEDRELYIPIGPTALVAMSLAIGLCLRAGGDGPWEAAALTDDLIGGDVIPALVRLRNEREGRERP